MRSIGKAANRIFPSCARAALLVSALLVFVGRAAGQNDLVYHVNPPRVPLTRSEVIPKDIPFCSNGLVICYSPALIRGAYNFPANLDGRGQTILIVVAYGDPTIRHDLEVFDKFFDVPPPPLFKILCPAGGCPKYDPTNHPDELSWDIETSLDVEYAHAMAPAANIVLAVAENEMGSAINAAMARAIKQYPGCVMSLSFGTPEIENRGNRYQFLQSHKIFRAAAEARITVLAAAGDSGATNGFTSYNAMFPASDPMVLAVGGTEGKPYPRGLAGCGSSRCTGTYGGEQVWNEGGYATGGAPSLIFPTPPYQSALGLKMRTTPDVAFNAAINGGVLVANSSVIGVDTFFLSGGTSAAAPQWAGIMALANQAAGRPLGFVNPMIYKMAASSEYSNDFHDVTSGNNKASGIPAGFKAVPGYDFATGWGTPNVTNLIADLSGASGR